MSRSNALRALKAVSIPSPSSSTSLLPATCRFSFPKVIPSASLRPFSSATRVFAAPRSIDETLGAALDSKFERVNDYTAIVPGQGEYQNIAEGEWTPDTRYHLHIYSHKHNTHITLTKPNRDALISISCGNIGFKGAGRSSYDAAYQLAAFVMARIQDMGHIPQIEQHKLELIYRGFGAGREAVTKAILGSEGSKIRAHIVKLSDSTRLKFGGTRSRKPRRLG